MTLVEATARTQIADFVDALVTVYTVLIFVYILSSWLFAFGARVPYSRWSDALLKFLRDVYEPYLRIFRRVIPTFGAIDLSPILAIIVLQVGGRLLARAIRGY